MNTNKTLQNLRGRLRRVVLATVAAGLVVSGSATAQVDVAQVPLYLGTDVPGNLLLTPSVEWPTIISQANRGNYDNNRAYVGYFDARKCYRYHFSETEAERHFYPVEFTTGNSCAGDKWSGNFLNWAATQTIDPFRLALTGGYRVRDTATETWLEKARSDRPQQFPNRSISSNVNARTPASWPAFHTGIQGLGNKMRFRASAFPDGNPGTGVVAVPYDPALHATLDSAVTYEVSVRVRVCVADLLEANCVQYASAAKPEGLLQEYSDRIRYGIFGYLNIDGQNRDGGVMRSRMKFIGNQIFRAGLDPIPNPQREWDPVTGVIYQNPNPEDATATGNGVAHSGVLNYLNMFGQMTSKQHKSQDPVSEMFYAATRYLRNLGNVPEYSNLTGDANNQFIQADGFPVITNWDDPIAYSCQKNALLGIGDVFTHNDKNLPGSPHTSNEPARPSAVVADTAINVDTLMEEVGRIEGLNLRGAPFTGRGNSAYIAGLAWHLNTRDIRPDLPGRQTAQTYWVDVVENQVVEPRNRNQYWLAAKYGGFRVPEGFNPATYAGPMPDAWWHTTGDRLPNTNDKRPDNFFLANEANLMVDSLSQAFRQISQSLEGSGASLAANTTRLEAGAITYQARFVSGDWTGDLVAFNVDPETGAMDTGNPRWMAASLLAQRDWNPATSWANNGRRIFVSNPGGQQNQQFRAFTWNNLTSAQQSALGSQTVMNYFRGQRSGEMANGGTLRDRQWTLGDIVHSEPVFVGSPNPRLYMNNPSFDGAGAYQAFVNQQANRTPIVYVGTNQGMLHGFHGNTGVEHLAFVPNLAIQAGMAEYASPDYEHKYLLDGEITVADVYGGTPARWRTVLVGTMGRGGQGIYALDVTDPNNVEYLWERNATQIPALGQNLGKPIIAQVANGTWRVILGNGPNSSGNRAQLVMVNVFTGNVTTVDTNVGGSNGLTAVQAWDSTQDGFADTAYAGDLRGNLWRFSNLGGSPSVQRVFEATYAGDPQPITAAPLVARNPADGQTWVFFGTGRYLGESDLNNTAVNSWYGIIDSGVEVVGRGNLVKSEIIAEVAIGNDRVARAISEASSDEFLGKDGWYMDLISPVRGQEGERMVVPNRFQGMVLVGTTRIPDSSDPCNPSGRGHIMAINPFTGARLPRSFFDLDGDGTVGPSDMIEVNGVPVPASGVGFQSSPNNPIFVGSVMQVGFDDASTTSILTSQPALGLRRASWREIIAP